MAMGPAFKQNLEVESFDNIEVFNLLAGLYGTASDNLTILFDQ